MTFTTGLLILLIAALICCAVGFYKYVYFISIGYGFAISGQGAVMLFLFRNQLTLPVILSCIILICYGFRLSGFLLYREIRSGSYRKHMTKEIKDGSSMSLFVKAMLWLFCALLYLLMISPIYYRFLNGVLTVTPSYIIGTIFMIGGILLESYSDYTKNRQKKQRPGRFCDQGIFRLVRCPNYLGELILWTGVLITGAPAFCTVGQWILGVLGYIGIVFVMFSGARRLELRQNRNYGKDPEYQQYVHTVPILLPFVPLYSVEKYKFLVL